VTWKSAVIFGKSTKVTVMNHKYLIGSKQNFEGGLSLGPFRGTVNALPEWKFYEMTIIN